MPATWWPGCSPWWRWRRPGCAEAHSRGLAAGAATLASRAWRTMEQRMRILVLLLALATPVVAWLSQTGAFGPDQGTISDRYPTLLVAAGWAFSIWSLIFVLDIVHGVLQMTGRRKRDPVLDRIAPATAAGFFLTAIWMPLFSQELFWLCLLVIFGAL